jgi:hypothetical protein
MVDTYQVEIYNPESGIVVDATSKTLAYQTSEELDKSILDFVINAINIQGVHLFNKLIIKKNEATILTGVIVDQSDAQSSGVKTTTFKCQNNGYYALKRIVAEIYRGKTASFILTHLINKYFPEVSTAMIKQSKAVLSEVKFTYITLEDAIAYIMELMPGWRYYIDNLDRFHFFYRTDDTATAITQDMVALDSLSVNYHGVNHYNRVWIVGNKEAAPNTIDVFYLSDAVQKYFGPLPYEPSDLEVFLKVDGEQEIQLTTAVEGESGDFQVIYNAKQRVFFLTDPTTLVGVLRANFKPVRQFIDYYENVEDIHKRGLMERSIKNKDVTNQSETRRYGKSQVEELSVVKRTIQFASDHHDVLTVALGDKRFVSIVTNLWDISGDFVVTKISRDVSANRDKTEILSVEMEELSAWAL